MYRKSNLRRSFSLVAVFVVLLWAITVADIVFGLGLYRYGIYPRRVESLWGILFAPLVHGSIKHLFSNTLPLLVLGTALLYGYPRASRMVIPAIVVGAGLGVWLLGRGSYHIGASGITFGLLSFVFFMGVVRWDPRAIALSCLVFFLYGGMIWGIFPLQAGVSFEYHLAGAATGAACVWFCRHTDPPPAPKHYDWEDEDDSTPEASVPPGAPGFGSRSA